MNARNEKGGAATPPKTAHAQAPGQFGRYHPPIDPRKPTRFTSGNHTFKTKGHRAQLLRALIAAGSEGVAHVEVMPWLLNASDAAKALRDRHGLQIDVRRGRPNRWVLRSPVREVQA